MKRMIAFLLLFLLCISVQAGSEDDARARYAALYAEMVRNLSYGNSYEQIKAAQIFGAHRNPRFIRPLAEALNREISDPIGKKLSQNDPYVKAWLAWALGRIGHVDSLPPLLNALETTSKMIDEQAKAVEEKRQKIARLYGSAEKEKEGSVVLDLGKPTPGRLKAGFRYPASPDIYWSVADEFKHVMAPDPDFETHAIRLKNYNYVNLAQALLLSIARIGSPESIEAIKPYAAHPLKYLRSYAALALESTANRAAIGPLEERLKSEEDPLVKVYLHRAIVMLDKSQVKSIRELIKSLKADNEEVRLTTVRALSDAGLGETENYLRAALEIENNEAIRSALHSAISNAQIDNAMPVNY